MLQGDRFLVSPMFIAVRMADSNMIRCLHSLGASVNAVDGEKFPPLVIAVASGRDDIVMTLHDCGADMTVVNEGIAFSARTGNVTMIETLCTLGMDPTRPLSTGETPMLIAAYYGHVECIAARSSSR